MAPENPAEAASVLMKRGIAFLNENTPPSLGESIKCFDEALALRKALPPSEDPWALHVLAASWMNRGDALTRLGTPENLGEAVHSFDEALVVLRGIPLDTNPLFRRRFAIAWMNRGIALQAIGTQARLAEAVKSFEQGIDALKDVPEQVVIVASGWMNKANTLLRMEPPRLTEARESTKTACRLVGGVEEEDVVAAETSLKARTIFCQCVAHELEKESTDICTLVAEATDSVEAALKLARNWEQRGELRFRPLVSGLFRFGTLLHQRHQPDALTQFLISHIGGNETLVGNREDIEMHTAAVEALAVAWNDLQDEGFSAVNTPRFDSWLETLRTLRTLDERLRELRACSSLPTTDG